MTLIIACKCKDGIVIASDSQATFGSSAGPIKKKTLDKIFPICDGILLGGAGDIPVIQKLRKQIDLIPQEMKESGKLDQIKDILCNQIIHQLRKDMLNKFKDLYGEVRGEKESPNASYILVGYSTTGIPTIYLITNDGLDEEENDYCAIGIGDAFAQILLKDIDTCSLEIEKVKPIVYKAIQDAIETGAYGMGEPITIWTITKNEKSLNKNKSELVNKTELIAIKDTVSGMKELMKDILIKTNNKDETKK